MIYIDLFFTFFKIGLFTFGGGYAMLPLIEQEVLSHKWLTIEQIVDFIAISESTPGPFAVNMATHIGASTGGILGALCATLGVVMPSFIVILIVAKLYEKFKNSSIVKGCMSGLRPAVIGLIGSAIITVASGVFLIDGFDRFSFSINTIISLGILILCTFLAFKKLHPIFIIIISGIIGIISGYAL